MNKYVILRLVLNFFEIAACIAGLIYWKKVKDTYWKWFSVYLVVITVTELVAEYFGYIKHNIPVNAAINNYFSIPLEFLFYCWLFYKWFNSSKRKWPLIGAVLYLLSLLAEEFYFTHKNFWFLSFSYTTGNIILLMLVIMVFYNFITSDRILRYHSDMMFWVCLGLMIFYLGSLPFYGLWNTLRFEESDVFNAYWIVQMIMNYVLYILIVVAYICKPLK